jgi:hypothetical protein
MAVIIRDRIRAAIKKGQNASTFNSRVGPKTTTAGYGSTTGASTTDVYGGCEFKASRSRRVMETGEK